MKVGGIQPVTLLDYPKKVAAIIFVSGCNFRCPFCYNPSLVLPELTTKAKLISPEDLVVFLKKRKKYLDGLVITGGEPTVDPDLLPFLKQVKKMGYDIKLDTNGSNPDVLQAVIDSGLADYLAMDIKGPLDSYEKYCGLKIDPEVLKISIGLVKNSGLPHEFRSTLIKGYHQTADIESMAQAIGRAKLYYLQNFVPQKRLVGQKFSGRIFTPAELGVMKQLAEEYVQECLIR